MDLSGIGWDAAGLVTAVAQHRHTGEVCMVAHASEEAVRRTVESGQAWFFSRSRRALWRKGETSGHTLAVHEVWADCDGDALIYLVEPAGPACHTQRRTCFFRRLGASAGPDAHSSPTLVRLWDTLEARRVPQGEKSYTRSLLDAGAGTVGDKIREEADELARAVAGESDDRVVAEAADLLYHLAVGLLARDLTLADVEAELARRSGTSGHAEKASRNSGDR